MSHDRHLRHVDRLQLIKSDVIKTIPGFVQSQGEGLKIALLNLDVGLYELTKCALEYFAPKMTWAGVIIFNEYAVTTFGGETKAVDEYFLKRFGKTPVVRKFLWHSNPSGFIEVDW